MQKEIFEQPQAIRDTLESRITKESVLVSAFGQMLEMFSKTLNKYKLLLVAQATTLV